MKYIDEFRNKNLMQKILQRIQEIAPQGEINLMEVCGTHTQSFFRFGLDKLLPPNIQLISGPGCPVCVSTQDYIDQAIKLANYRDVIILTFGDMLRIPGSKSSLEKERANQAQVRVIYSPLDSLRVAQKNSAKKIIFLAVGFETTAPAIALTIMEAKREKLKNIYFFCALKLIPPAMGHLLKDKRLNLSGFLCPGHVSSIIGTRPYEFVPKKYKIPCCISGFEPLDILESVYILLEQIKKKSPRVANQYMRVVKREGNPKAKRIIAEVFKISDAAWRGFGKITQSGLKVKEKYSMFDAEKIFSIKRTTHNAPRTTQCRCGDVLKGLISPSDCPLFAKLCSPENPIGPCMVSSEGTCNAYYKYR
ncbi:MAG: hydrogenase formation protein HypD [Candidatus Omnitrophica bacterium]|nr:hydrogenase formation protein HypD [Candidatus Omnitrophota bacterium]